MHARASIGTIQQPMPRPQFLGCIDAKAIRAICSPIVAVAATATISGIRRSQSGNSSEIGNSYSAHHICHALCPLIPYLKKYKTSCDSVYCRLASGSLMLTSNGSQARASRSQGLRFIAMPRPMHRASCPSSIPTIHRQRLRCGFVVWKSPAHSNQAGLQN